MRSTDPVRAQVNRPISRKKATLFSAVITVASLIFLFVVCELGLAKYYSEEESANWIRFHSVRGWALAPGDYWVKPLHRLSRFSLRINQWGLREHKTAKLSRDNRVILLGDSFTFAKETATEHMFSQRLQHLADRQQTDVEVMNAGVPAYGTAQQLLLMTALAEEYQIQAKTYVLVFFTNDILDNLCLSYGELTPQPVRPCFVITEQGRPILQTYPAKRAEGSGDDTLVAARQSTWGLRTVSVMRSLTEDWLQTRPGLVHMLTRVGVSARVARIPGLLNGWYRDDVLNRGVALTRALIREMQLEARKHGGQLIVTMVPSPFQVYSDTYIPLLERSFQGSPLVERFSSDPLRPQRLVREICEEAEIPFHDLFPAFRGQNHRTLFIPRDGHLNDQGHELVAGKLFEFVGSQTAHARR